MFPEMHVMIEKADNFKIVVGLSDMASRGTRNHLDALPMVFFQICRQKMIVKFKLKMAWQAQFFSQSFVTLEN